MDDLISRQAAIDALGNEPFAFSEYENGLHDEWENNVEALMNLPSAQPEIKPIEYRDCANAMLVMWMDNVVTDGEYNRIMDKLNVHWGKDEDETN